MHAVFEMFSATPVSIPEEARFHVPGNGPLGPPPPAHPPPFLGWWEAGCVVISPDEVLNLNSAALTVIPILGSITDWMVEAPVAALHSSILGEVSCLAWELFIASLCIPWAQSEFDALCSNPPAFWEAAELVLKSLIASIEEVSLCHTPALTGGGPSTSFGTLLVQYTKHLPVRWPPVLHAVCPCCHPLTQASLWGGVLQWGQVPATGFITAHVSFACPNCIYASPALAARDVTGVQMGALVRGGHELAVNL
jgi:hypothetical protein